MKRKVLSLILAVVFAISVMPVMGAPTSGKCGDNIIWTFINGVLTLDGTDAMYDYSSEEPAPWSEIMGGVRKIVVMEGIAHIGNYAFANCVNATEVSLPNTLQTIGDRAFRNLINLGEIVIPEGVTSMGDGVFAWNDNLSKAVIYDNVSYIGSDVFEACENLSVYGIAGSGAESYAQQNGIQFISIGGDDSIGDKIILTIDENDAMVYGKVQTNDVAPIIRNSRTMLPARFVAEELGAEVSWYAPQQLVIITKGDIKIIIAIDSTVATVNGETVSLDSPAFIENGRTYTPVRFIVENLGASVEWNGEARQVIITK